MLPGIREDQTSEFSVFNPKYIPKAMNSSCKHNSDLLKRKIREIQSNNRVKIPEVLKNYRKAKKNSETFQIYNDFPSLQNTIGKIKTLSLSPDKIFEKNRCVTVKKKKFKLDKSNFLLDS